MKRNLTRLAILCALAALAAGVLQVSGVGARATAMLAVLGRLGPSTISLALGLSTLSALLSGVVWWRLLLRLGYRTPFRVALAAYLSAGLAGYVVNIAGPALGSALSLRRHGVSPGRAILLTLLANALGFCGILVWAPVGLLLLSRTGMDGALPILGRHGSLAAAIILAALGVAMLLVLRALATVAGSRNRLARRLLGHARTTEESDLAPLRARQVFALAPCSALSWVVGAGALYVVLGAMNHGATVTLGTVIGAAVLAAALGSLAFFAPEGVGVKDGALVALLAHATGLPLTTLVAVALAVRALDPVTKFSLLGVLALTANGAVARLSVAVATSIRRGMIGIWLRPSPEAPARRGLGFLATGLLALVVLVVGHGGIARADHDTSPFADGAHPALVSSVSYNRPPVIDRCLGRSASDIGTLHADRAACG
ncbi:MAG TPA: lysylphosphatidylglycerol synthase domain-containing protein [Chloroflexota bacterium]|nr:lysylphosphatidylglycerol synthase domain-containing protein [Chloroflexota bacterium]